eukprot:3708031-Pyramimonas_sp.AAC.1
MDSRPPGVDSRPYRPRAGELDDKHVLPCKPGRNVHLHVRESGVLGDHSHHVQIRFAPGRRVDHDRLADHLSLSPPGDDVGLRLQGAVQTSVHEGVGARGQCPYDRTRRARLLYKQGLVRGPAGRGQDNTSARLSVTRKSQGAVEPLFSGRIAASITSGSQH